MKTKTHSGQEDDKKHLKKPALLAAFVISAFAGTTSASQAMLIRVLLANSFRARCESVFAI